ncbi:MAG: glycogen debranching protein GlgX [Myxococcaceae bacterium]
MSDDVWPGRAAPLGATLTGDGVNFAVYSESATRVEVCLFEENPPRESRRLRLHETTHHVWHGFVPGLAPGALYGFRVDGPRAPDKGFRFDPERVLLDPYARELRALGDAAFVLRVGVVGEDAFDWQGVGSPNIPWHETILYELHVRGMTARHPDVPPELRGTYRGLTHPAVIEHLKHLGVTTLELLPVHEAIDEAFLVSRGLTNYWGYNPIAFFAPTRRYASPGGSGPVVEFKEMVRGLHTAGFEVILDVVFNHTGEGNHLGPMLSFRGLDNPTYYRLRRDDPSAYVDYTGTGNTMAVHHPQVMQLITDCLRYWVNVMQVDGFRFDLGVALGRGESAFDRGAAFFQAIHQDPVLSQVKLIAEPWDLGEGGYQLANFPKDWCEWNGRYRDAFREFWRGDPWKGAEIGYRLTGSSDLFKLSGRKPWASINFITCHDGFTLHDLVTYNEKRNEANGENNRDGTNDNRSWNCGVEGETEDVEIVTLRERQKRNFLATLLVSGGVPMLSAGDEMGRSQGGNNNAYCQDNETSWLNWTLDERQRALLEFTRRMVWLRKQEPVLQRRKFFEGVTIRDSVLKDATWFRPDGEEMVPEDWANPHLHALAFLLGGDAIPTPDDRGNRVRGDTLLVMMNAGRRALVFTLPEVRWGNSWEIVEDTVDFKGHKRDQQPAGSALEVASHALVVLRRPAMD